MSSHGCISTSVAAPGKVEQILRRAEVKTSVDANLRLGRRILRIVSVEPAPAVLARFSRAAFATEAELAHFTQIIVPTSLRQRFPFESDLHARAKEFRRGYYATNHYGPFADTVTLSLDCQLLFADMPELIVWPYTAKRFLLEQTLDERHLFLKAAAVSVDDGGAFLVVGRSGGGKTSLMHAICQTGAKFLANSHVLMDGGQVHPIYTNIRVRPNMLERYEEVRALPTEDGDWIVEPETLYRLSAAVPHELRGIIVVDYQGTSLPVSPATVDAITSMIKTFGLGVSAYGLQDDLWELVGGSIDIFSQQMRHWEHSIEQLAHSVPVRYVTGSVSSLEAIFNS